MYIYNTVTYINISKYPINSTTTTRNHLDSEYILKIIFAFYVLWHGCHLFMIFIVIGVFKTPFFYFLSTGKNPKLILNCSKNMNVSTVWGPSRTKAGTYPLKNPRGPSFAVWMIRAPKFANSPGFAFIALVFSTSKGCVSVVAIAPCHHSSDV